LTFEYVDKPEETEVFVGSIDEEVLCGKKVGEEGVGRYGRRAIREGGFGKELVDARRSGHIWWENAVEGVGEELKGTRFWREREDGEGWVEGENEDGK